MGKVLTVLKRDFQSTYKKKKKTLAVKRCLFKCFLKLVFFYSQLDRKLRNDVTIV